MHERKDHRGRGVASPASAMPYPVATSRKQLLGWNAPGPRSARPTGSTASSASGRLRRKVGMVEMIRLADEPWAPVAQGHPGAEVVRSVRVALRAGTAGFSEPEQLTQRKSKRLIEGFVCNPLLSHCLGYECVCGGTNILVVSGIVVCVSQFVERTYNWLSCH